jgi:integrase
MAHRDYPDHVRKKQGAGDIKILKKWINPVVGSIPLRMFQLEDADRVMRGLPPPPTPGPAYRRHVAQVVHRVLALAVFPGRIIPANPLPKGWLPKLPRPKARSCLYPAEESKLLGRRESELGYRLLMGILNREGMRKAEAKASEWTDYDLDLPGDSGTITLDKNKTDCPRSWPLEPSVVRALRIWKRVHGGRGPFAELDVAHLAEWQRSALIEAGVDRPQLYQQTEQRIRYRAHDCRSTFVTLSLANDRTEAWIMRRTAHTSSTMIARYAGQREGAQPRTAPSARRSHPRAPRCRSGGRGRGLDRGLGFDPSGPKRSSRASPNG